MKSFFSPAITLMNRLGYTRKFTLLALMALIAFTTVAYNLYINLDKEVRLSQRELDGLALTKPIIQLVRAIQQHRGRLAMAASGGDVGGDEYAAIETRAATAFEETEGKLPPGLKEGESWPRIKAAWEYLEREQSSMTAEDSFAAHTRLIENLLIFLVGVADEHALTLDPQIDTYYLIDTAINKLPAALEHIGQLRAYGSSILVRKQISEEQRINIFKIFGMLEDAHVVLEINLEKTGRYNPVLRSSLAAAAREIAGSSQQVVSAMESDILSGHFSMPPGSFFAKATLAIDKGYAQLYDALLPTTEALLKARIVRAERVLRASIGIAVLLLLIMVYFATGIYYSITGSVKMLAHSAHAFAGGNMRERAKLDTRDELRQVGDSFNEMADGFSAILAENKRAQQALQQNQELLNEAQRLGQLGSWELDLVSGRLRWSDEIYRIFELDPARFSPSYENFLNAIHPDDRDGVNRAYTQSLQDRQPYDVTHRLLLADGRIKWVHEYCTSKFDASGKPLRSVGAVQDITERKQAEDAIRESKDFLLSVMEHTPARIFWKDRDSRYLGCNSRFAQDAGYPIPGELVGKTDFEMGWRDQAELYRADDRAVMESGNPKLDYEEPQTTPDGNLIWLSTSKVPLRDRSDRVIGILGIYQDITARKQAEEGLREYNNKLEAMNHQLRDAQNQLMQSEKMASIGQLAAGVAHEINNPIGYVFSNLGTLERYMQDVIAMVEKYEVVEKLMTDDVACARLRAEREKLDLAFLKEDLRALMGESKDGITRVKNIVQNLKDFSHVDASDAWHFADLHKGLDSTLNIVRNEIKYKAEVVKEYGDLPEVECLPSQLNQVFMNLLVNAAHAIEERGTITIRTGQQDGEAWVEVADTGKGIKPEHLNKIFDPFFTTKPIGKGTGLGLSLSYGIVQKHGGRIEVQSEVGKGTTFRVWLPVRRAQGEAE